MMNGQEGIKLTSVLSAVCSSISRYDLKEAREILESGASFNPMPRVKRRYTEIQALSVFQRDGFIDRYSGDRLVFPGTLRLLSHYLPEAFPFDPHWHTEKTHFAYWLLCPTIDHVVPVTRGGSDNLDNLVTTSQLHNSVKGLWFLSELRWELHPAGSLDEWDGLLGWFKKQVREDEGANSCAYIKRWQRALIG
jgi:5-methylcytosine-specific restriction endonuclease McrA